MDHVTEQKIARLLDQVEDGATEARRMVLTYEKLARELRALLNANDLDELPPAA